MKRKKKKIVILLCVLVVLIAVIGGYFLLRDENRLSSSERLWITENANVVQNVYVLNDANYKAVTSWISDTLFSFLPDEDVSVSSAVTYQNISGDYFKNNSNEVLSITDGRVIETGIDDGSGSYVTVLGKDEVEITYGNIDNVMVALYDEVAQGMILGSYQEQLILKFEYLGEEITYEEYQRME